MGPNVIVPFKFNGGDFFAEVTPGTTETLDVSVMVLPVREWMSFNGSGPSVCSFRWSRHKKQLTPQMTIELMGLSGIEENLTAAIVKFDAEVEAACSAEEQNDPVAAQWALARATDRLASAMELFALATTIRTIVPDDSASSEVVKQAFRRLDSHPLLSPDEKRVPYKR
jgi:hypothetical protein